MNIEEGFDKGQYDSMDERVSLAAVMSRIMFQLDNTEGEVTIMKGFKRVAASLVATAMFASCMPAMAENLAEDFNTPPMSSRMRSRVWWPGANISDEMIAYEVQELAEAGIAGLEVVAIAEGYDASKLDPETDGWGTAQWNHAMEVLVTEAEKYDLQVDMTIGPRWPAGVPGVDVNNDYVSKKILSSSDHIMVEAVQEGTFTIPAMPDGDYARSLAAVVVARTDGIIGTSEVKGRMIGDGTGGSNAVQVISEYALLSDTLERIDSSAIDEENGTFIWTPSEPGEWTVFSFWMTSVGQTSGSTVPTAYVIDHFSVGGTRLMLDYWDSSLTDVIKEHWAKNGGGIFEDSLELSGCDLWWSVDLEAYFAENYGYDIYTYLPLLISRNSTGNLLEIYTATDNADINEEVNNDYLNNLSDMYIENHIDVVTEWCHSYGLEYRAQAQGTGDTVWVEPGHSQAHVDVIEGETLGMGQSPDAFRTLAGSASFSGNDVISVEYGAEFGSEYQVTWEWLLELLHRSVMVGANQFNLHGFASRAQYTDSTCWPGWMPFDQPHFSEAWNEAQPVWEYMKEDFTDYVSRLQTYMQYGTRKADFAVYRDCGMRTDGEGTKDGVLYLDGDNPAAENPVTMLGYTYHYVSPSNFDMERAVVEDGILVPEGAAYKALVIYGQDSMELAAAEKILEYAQQGLKIILIGETPDKDGTFSGNDDDAVVAVFEQLKNMDTVYCIEKQEELPAALTEAGITPDAQYEKNYLVSQHREADDADLYFIYNNTNSRDYYNSFAGPGDSWTYYNAEDAITTQVTLKGEGKPYLFNAWTGEITPILEYTDNGDGTISTTVTVNDCAAVLIGIAQDGVFGDFNAANVVRNAGAGELIWENGQVIYRTEQADTYSVSINGETVEGKVDATSAAISLDDNTWSLTVTSWQPGEKALDPTAEDYDATDIAKIELPSIELNGLKAWNEIEALADVSGRGVYETTFTLEGSFTGAYLDLGASYDSVLEVSVNGSVLAPTDQFTCVYDLEGVVKAGENTLTVKTGTTLAKAVRANGGNCAENDFHGSYPSIYGLLGGVTVIPYIDTILG